MECDNKYEMEGKKKKDRGRTMEKKGQEYYKVENDTV